MTTVPNVALHDDITIPQLGFGVFKVPDDQTEAVVTEALEVGFRSIDTASLYGNERGVGAAVAASGLAREDVFVTTKVWNDDQGYDATLAACERSLTELGLGHVDLYLIHWPAPARGLYLETWRALQALRADGRVRAIGVSNFQPAHLARLIEDSGIVPAVNQVELHPHLQQPALRAFHAEHGIATEAWAPLARGRLLDDPSIVELARRHQRTPAQVVLRWHLELGTIAIPKSATPARIRENFDVLSFSLSPEDVQVMADLDTGTRGGPDPDTFS